jgi:chloride channel protein, CIC family
VFEMTLDYNVVVPLLLGSAIASLVATRFSKESVYTEALRRRTAAPGDAAARSVATLRVADLMRAEHAKVSPDCTAPRLFDVFVGARRNHVYVVGDRGEFLGAVDLHDLNAVLQDAADPGTLTAGELMRVGFPTTLPDEPVVALLETFEWEDCERLPVLANARSKRLVGTISRRDILSACRAERLAANASRPPIS